jgi:ABC-type branched-subunit amino acid transport system ATPase component
MWPNLAGINRQASGGGWKLHDAGGRPKFMLLDEPFAGIDPIAVEDIQSIVAGLKSAVGNLLQIQRPQTYRSPTARILCVTAIS